ncbi:hypothetical protein CIPAW_15G033400 [Carya illinoinensis]|uniref:Amino acid transporter transmembrane domain-containing protein n=2 Tax=Carya illinoinensis TaxID=32201 RepID=A0A8T1N3Z8_CARIL|nr:hypothetical protein CIPAW_15G033400 [Carya illinoinensis]KAG6674240.1 hypothetical protein I3842_15G032200 [Carya illinoinensis]
MQHTNNQMLSDHDLLPRGSRTSECFDEDGRPKRAGTVWSASVSITTAVAGPAFDLSLAWSVAQLGWVAGPAVIIFFSLVTYCTSALLCACYRSPVTAKRNHTYMDAIRSHLDGAKVKTCWVIQYVNLLVQASGYTVFASLMMRDIERFSKCGNAASDDACYVNSMPYFIAFAVAQIIFSQIPKFSQLRSFSILRLMMFLFYSGIGLGLVIAKLAGVNGIYYTDHSIGTMTRAQKMLNIFRAIGNIAQLYDSSAVLIEIEDTVESPPSEVETMRSAIRRGLTLTTFVSMLYGCMGFAAFGNNSPVFLLYAFYKPYWLLNIASAAIVIQYAGGYQIYLQPIFGMAEETLANRFPDNEFITKDIKIPTGCRHFGPYKLNLFRLVWRTVFVITTTVLSMFLALYLDLLKLIQILSFWPIAVYFPVEMYIVQKKIPKWSKRWICLQILSLGCLIVTIATAAASSVDLFSIEPKYYPFKPNF